MKKRIYIIGAFLISLCLLSFSCAFNIIPEDQGNGSVSFYLPTSREVRGNENKEQNIEQPLEYTVSIKSEDGKYNFENKYLEGDTVKVDKLAENTYLISATAEDDKYTYSGKAKQVIKARESVSVTLDITPTLKGGYIDLSFGNIKFDENATINVVVKDAEDKECFNKKDIPVKEFNDNKYSLPYIFKQGEYKVLVAGGNTDKEVYVVEQGTLIPVVRGVVSLCTVEAIPYHAIYVKASSQAEEKGTESNPFKTITKALEYVNTINIPAKIVIDGEQAITSPLLITQDMSIQLCGKNNASILSNSSEVIINQGNLVLYNIEISNSASKTSVVYESGNIVLENDVYIDSISLAQDMKLQINKPLKLSSEKNMSIFIPTYTEGIKVFNFKLGVGINTDFIKLESADFRINGKGELERIVKPLTITPTNFTNCKNITYRVLSMDNQEIIPLTKLETVDVMNPNALVPNLKAGLQYTIELYADSINGNAPDKSGLQNNVEAYRKVWSQNITIDALNDNKVDFDLSSNGAFSTGSLYISSKSTDIKGYPLTLTLVGNNGYKTTQTLFGIPTYINYLPEGTYRVSLTGESIKEGYELTSDTINIVNGKTSLEGEFRPIPKSIYYVSNIGKEGATGSSSDPFVSLNVAFTKLENSTTPITLIIKDNISVTTPILISTPLDVTIIGNNSTAKPQISGSADIEILSLNNPNCNVTFRKLAIKSNGGVFNNIDGILNLEDGVELLSDTSNTKAISVSSNGVLNLKGNINLSNTYIELKDNRKINVVGLLTSPTPLKVSVVAPYNGREVFDFANENLENLVSTNFAYFDDTYKFDYETKKLLESDIFNFNDTRNQLLAPPSSSLSIRTYLDNEYELHEVGKLLRGLPNNQRVSLDLKVNKNINTLDSTVFNPLLNGINTLESITIPDSIIYIDENTFAYSPNLTTVNFGQGYTWAYESDINTINPSENPTLVADNLKLKDCAFGRVVQLVDIKSILSDPTMSGNKGFIVDSSEKNLTELSNLIKNYKGGNIVLDLHLTSITDIPANCFTECKNLTKVVLPASLTSIGANAFSGCDNLVSVVFSELSTWTIGSEEYIPYLEKAKTTENANKLKASTSTWSKNNIINLYVDGSLGDDELNNGTASNKFKTVSKAVSLLNRNSSSTINSDVIIHVNGTVQENKEILINKKCNITIVGNDSNATIESKTLPLQSGQSSHGHRVLKIGSRDSEWLIEPTVTLKNINITGECSSESLNDGNGIVLELGTLILDNGTNIYNNGKPNPHEKPNPQEQYLPAVFVSANAKGLILKGNASVGKSTETYKNSIYLGRNPNYGLAKLIVDENYSGNAYLDGMFKKDDIVLVGDSSKLKILLPINLVINQTSNKVELKEFKDTEITSIIKQAPHTGDGVEGIEILANISDPINIKTYIMNNVYGQNNNKLIALLDLSPSPITEIPSNALCPTSEYGRIDNIILPKDLLSIGNDAFKNSGISSIKLPKSVYKLAPNSLNYSQSVGNASVNENYKIFFENIKNLWRNSKTYRLFTPTDDGIYNYNVINFESSDKNTAWEWNRLENVDTAVSQISNYSGSLEIPNLVYVYIEHFEDYAKLKDAINGLTQGSVCLYIASKDNTIPSNAFDGFTEKLSSVVLTSNIKIIEQNAFSNSSIPKIGFDDTTSSWTSSDGTQFIPNVDGSINKNNIAVSNKSFSQVASVADIQNLLSEPNTTGDQVLLVNAKDSDINALGTSIKNYSKGNITLDLSCSHTLRSIPDNTFDGCSKLKELKLPSSIQSIGINTFANCTGLTNVTFADDAPWLISSEFNPKATTTSLTSYIANMENPVVNATKLKETSDQYWIKPLNKNNIEDFIINYDNTFEATIYYYADYGNLSYLTDQLKKVGTILEGSNIQVKDYSVNLYLYMAPKYGLIEREFSGINLNGPYNETVGTSTQCLRRLELLPDNNTIKKIICSGAFTDCDSLISFNYPSNVEIYSGAFSSCDSLESINGNTIKNGCFIVEKQDEQGNTYKELNSFTNSSKIPTPQLEEGINVIGPYAFKQCTNVTGVVIPNSVTKIGSYAFSMCPKIQSISLPQNSSWTIVNSQEKFNYYDSVKAKEALTDIYLENTSYVGKGTSDWIKN